MTYHHSAQRAQRSKPESRARTVVDAIALSRFPTEMWRSGGEVDFVSASYSLSEQHRLLKRVRLLGQTIIQPSERSAASQSRAREQSPTAISSTVLLYFNLIYSFLVFILIFKFSLGFNSKKCIGSENDPWVALNGGMTVDLRWSRNTTTTPHSSLLLILLYLLILFHYLINLMLFVAAFQRKRRVALRR